FAHCHDALKDMIGGHAREQPCTHPTPSSSQLADVFRTLLSTHRKGYIRWTEAFRLSSSSSSSVGQSTVPFDTFFERLIASAPTLHPHESDTNDEDESTIRQKQVATMVHSLLRGTSHVSLYQWLVILDQFGPSLRDLLRHLNLFPIVSSPSLT